MGQGARPGVQYQQLLAACVLAAVMLVSATGRVQDSPPGAATASMPAICTEEEACKCTRTAAGFWVHVACSCSAHGQGVLEIRGDHLPAELQELDLRDCREVRLLPGALSHLRALRRVRASGVGTLTVRRHAFLNSTAANPLLQADNCSAVVLESAAWRGTRGPQSVSLDRCGHVVIQPSTFSWLQDFRARHIARLELQKHAFSQQGNVIGRHGSATSVVIEDSLLAEIPTSAFPASAAELRLERCEVRAVRKDAFCGLDVAALTLRDCALGTMERGALSARTLVHRLALEGVRDANLASGAVQSAVTNLLIQHSRFQSVSEGAINTTISSASLLHNTFQRVSSRGLMFHSWDQLELENNTFLFLEPSGLWSTNERPAANFTFIDNTIVHGGTSGGALHFGIQTSPSNLNVQVAGNRFNFTCKCELQARLKRELSPRVGEIADFNSEWVSYMVQQFYDTSLCVVNDDLARCFSGGHTNVGYMNMTNFWLKVCGDNSEIRCSAKDLIGYTVYNDTHRSSNHSRGRSMLLILIFIGVLMGVMLVAMTMYCKNLTDRRRNATHSISYSIRKYFRYICHASANNNNNNNLTETPTLPIDTVGTVSTDSIDHLPGDLVDIGRRKKRRRKRRPRRRDMGITVHEDMDLTDVTIGSSSDSEAGTDRTCSTFDSLLGSEDKSTQTVPEPDDLTEELLKELKEKLNDPNYYSEARDMIEHLYDLIKVEESNKSKPSTSSSIHKPPPTPPTPPIPEENEEDSEDERYAVIQPAPRPQIGPSTSGVRQNGGSATLCEYMEPQDHRHHVYTELPTVATRAVGFFRSLLPRGARRRDEEVGAPPPPAAITEYMEPTDARVHVYTELATNNMANRPLPQKPSSGEDSDSS